MLIIPTLNERENIATLVARVRASAGAQAILFVDDGSPDGTADEVARLQKDDSQIHLLRRVNKRGYASACRDGMRRILHENLDDIVIQADADLSHPPEALPIMLKLLKTHPVVIGSRYVRGGGAKNWDLRRRLLSSCGNRYARLLTGVPVHDMTAGFVGYHASVLRSIDLDSISSEGYAFLMEMKFLLHQRGVNFYEFPIIFTDREAGKSKFSSRIMLEGVKFPVRALRRRITLK
jgi:dolichol-phosphate mannosyltransferase